VLSRVGVQVYSRRGIPSRPSCSAPPVPALARFTP